MRAHPAPSDFVVAITCLGLILLFSVPPCYRTLKSLTSSKHHLQQIDGVYQDEDGTATTESENAFSHRFLCIILLVLPAIGAVVSAAFLAGAYLGVLCLLTGDRYSCQEHRDSTWIEQCLVLLSWAIILMQSCLVFRTRHPVKRYNLAVFGAVSSLILAVALPIEAYQWTSKRSIFSASTANTVLQLTEFVLAFATALAFLSLPRRPDVYLSGQAVDRQYSVSVLSRITFGWATSVLFMTAKTKNVTLDNFPLISNDLRANTLREVFNNVGTKDKLWKVIALSHKRWFVCQWIMQLLQAFFNFLPQVLLFAILKALEARDRGEGDALQLWMLVIAVGFSDAISTWVESWLYYFCFLKLGPGVYEMISTVVFNKAIRKKDVKGVSKTKEQTDSDGNAVMVDQNTSTKDEDAPQDDDSEDDAAKTKQSTINLISVDGKRVADCATYQSMVLGCSVKLTIAIFFLVGLIGWIPVMCGFGVFAIMTPINWVVARRYKRAQDDLMKFRDQKIAIVTEALQGIRQIKFSALENDWYDKILGARKKELATQWLVFLCDTVLLSLWIFGPVCLSAISLAAYALINKTLSPSVAFTTISVFESIEVTLGVIPELITEIFDALVSCQRIQKYLESADRTDELKPGESIVFEDATVSWPADETKEDQDQDQEAFKLRNLNIAFPNGELSVISGKTGSGKSLLLSAIVGEADIVEGNVYVPRVPTSDERFNHKAHRGNWIIKDAVAYVAQIPWIENATIKDNITFGLPFEEERYQKVLHASALEKDFEMLQDGDMTDIGANGINLSGGQKWRVSFARALYSRAGILILDDIFSAVDAHVGKHLFEEALTGELGQNRTRILVTHHVALCLPKTTFSVLLDNGTVLQAALTEELRQKGLIKEILAHDVEQERGTSDAEADQAVTIDDGGSLQKILSPRSAVIRRDSAASNSGLTLTRTRSLALEDEPVVRQPPKKFTEEEGREVGAVKLAVYKAYISAARGISWWAIIAAAYIIWSVAFLGRSYWVSIWSRDMDLESHPAAIVLQQSVRHFRTLTYELSLVEVEHSVVYYVGIYLAISLGQWFLGTWKYYFVYVASIHASKKLFEDLAYNILRTPLRFLDTTPLGRIINRFTGDFNMIDSRISYDLMFSLHTAISVISVIIAAIFISPWMILFATILLATCFWYASRYLAGAREVKRLESNAKSPVYEQFGSVLQGIGTIRAFARADEYVERMEQKINKHCQAYYHLWLFNRWMSLRVSWVGAIFLTIMAALAVGIPNIDAPLAGFALSFSLQLSEAIIWMLRQYANVELDLNAVERIVEYSRIPMENQSGHDAPAAWPTKGELEVNDLVVSYAPDLPPVLKGVSFSVKQHERVGVVGRTGAGKSSLTLALFRFLEAQSGSVWIDGIDISKIKLYDLRSRLAIIPQDPVLFSGTVRSNLDPFNQHSDSELRDALVRVHLIPSASTTPSGIATPSHVDSSSTSSTIGNAGTNINIFSSLASKISEGGLNLSQGQRQLLCLARAVVSRPKILVLDEATSSVDMETDALIQRSIREEFADATLIVIAHRLSTIADFDRILVLGEGKVVEFDRPAALLNKAGSVFRDMIEASGERQELEALVRGQQSA